MWLVSSFNFSILYFREKKDNHFQVVMTACSTMWKWWESSALKGAQRQGSLMGLLILFILSFFSCNHSYVRICIAILSEINKFWVLCWNPFKFKLLCCRLVTANVSHLNYCRILLTHWIFCCLELCIIYAIVIQQLEKLGKLGFTGIDGQHGK